MVAPIANLRRLTLMCLASLAHHRVFVGGLAVNHVVRVTIVLDRDAAHLLILSDNEVTTVVYPWSETAHVFTGIPPHAALLQELTVIKREQRNLVDSFITKVKTAIDESGVGTSALTAQGLKDMFEGFSTSLRHDLQNLETMGRGEARAVEERGRTERNRLETDDIRYDLHFFRGRFHRVPEDWRFPRIGVNDVWRQWWIGDTVRNIPPLRKLDAEDLKFLDKLPLTRAEMHGRAMLG